MAPTIDEVTSKLEAGLKSEGFPSDAAIAFSAFAKSAVMSRENRRRLEENFRSYEEQWKRLSFYLELWLDPLQFAGMVIDDELVDRRPSITTTTQ